MPSSNSRIISAEELGDVEPFSMGALPAEAESPIKRRAVVRPPEPKDDSLRQTFELGYRKGMEAGRSAAIQQVAQQERALGATLRARVEALSGSLEQEMRDFQVAGADRLLDLAIEIARQTLRDTISVKREAIVPVVQESLSQLHDENAPATLLINPIDVEIVQTNLAAMLARRDIELQPDPSIAMGGCRLRSAFADVDATIGTRWQRTLAAMGRRVSADEFVQGQPSDEPL